MTRYAVVPPVPALLSEYAGLADPVAELREAAASAVDWLVSARPCAVEVWGDPLTAADVGRGVAVPLAVRVAGDLLCGTGYAGPVRTRPPGPVPGDTAVLVLANGSARRGEKAPGHLDRRAFAFDAAVESALATGDAATLAGLDVALGVELWASGIAALRDLGAVLSGRGSPQARLRFADDPYGVRYWVATWSTDR